MNSNDKYMADFAKELNKIDEQLGLNKKASLSTVNQENVKEAKTKQNRPKPPKAWFEMMKEKVSKKEPDYSKTMVNETVGKIWFDELSDKQVEKLLKKYDSKKAKAELLNVMQNLVVLAGELENDGHSKAANLVDDVLNIIAKDVEE